MPTFYETFNEVVDEDTKNDGKFVFVLPFLVS